MITDSKLSLDAVVHFVNTELRDGEFGWQLPEGLKNLRKVIQELGLHFEKSNYDGDSAEEFILWAIVNHH